MRAAIENRHAHYRPGVRCALRAERTNHRPRRTVESRAKSGTTLVSQVRSLRLSAGFPVTKLARDISHKTPRLPSDTIRARRFESVHGDFPVYLWVKWTPRAVR